MNKSFVLKGHICYCQDKSTLKVFENSYLVCVDGKSKGVFETLPGNITVPAAVYTQDPESGLWTVTPGISVITVTGNI